jgi:hypothetical protein
MIDYMEIGPTPYEENCAQVGDLNYLELAKKELNAYRDQLYRMFPSAYSKGVSFIIKWFEHDFGTYGEVCIRWNTDDSNADDYAYEIERNLPGFWDQEAQNELELTND